MNVRVVSYNIRVGVETDVGTVADAAASLAPDLICMQEVGDRWLMGEKVDQTAHIAARCGLDHWHFAGALTAADGGQFGIAVASRWPLENCIAERLYQHEDERRIALRLWVAAPIPFTVLTTHLSVRTDDRQIQAARLAAVVQHIDGPLLFAGDLNDGPESESTQACRGDLHCAFDKAGIGCPLTFPSVAPTRRIDYIFHTPHFSAQGPTWVAKTLCASDHHPLVSELSLDRE